MEKLIIVSPHFPPTNAPDHQRARLSLPYWPKLGWEAEVIAVQPSQVAAPRDPFLASILPEDIPITRVNALGLNWSRLPGLGTLGYRCRRAVGAALQKALARWAGRFDTTVYFSTTQFPVHTLIPGLKRRYPNVKFVMDYQDPWVNHFYDRNPTIVPPGGRLKHRLVQSVARRAEPRVLRAIDGITMVSARYRHEICERNSWFDSTPWLELPFGGAAGDFEALQRILPTQSHFDSNDGNQHWVYAGRGGADMAFAARGLFRALRIARDRDPAMQKVRLHFLGTDYAPAGRGRATLKPVAIEEGVGAWVHEHPARLPYGEALKCLVDADALVVPGSTDPGYSASKIYPCILARRPLLALFHERSPVHAILAASRGGVGVPFDPAQDVDQLTTAILSAWFEHGTSQSKPNTNWDAFSAYSDRTMTNQLSEFLRSLRSR